MVEEDFVVWDDRYSVGVTLMDEQHKELLRETNELYKACREGDVAAEARFREVVKSTVDYVKTHFAQEEQIMERVKYPEFSNHKREHEVFVQKVLDEVKAFEEGKTFVPNNFVRFLRDWVLAHIALEDKKYGAFIAEIRKRQAS
jgi:hemerythrin